MTLALHQAQRLAEETLAYLQACDVVRTWQQQRQLGALPTFTLVKGTQSAEPDGAGAGDEEEAERAQERALLRYADQEPVNLGNAEEVAAFQRYRQVQRRVPGSRVGHARREGSLTGCRL